MTERTDNRTTSGRRRALLTCLLALALLAGLAGGREAAAHAFVASSDPAANAVVPTAPPQVTLKFTEPLERSYSRAQLFDEQGKEVPGTTSGFGDDPNTMVLGLPPNLPKGTYSVLWRTLSNADGHTAQGYLAFTVGSAADIQNVVPPAATTVDLGAPDWLKAVSRWFALLGLAAVIAVWPIWLFVVRPSLSPVWQIGPKTTRRVRGYAIGAVVVALLGALVALGVQAVGIGGDAGLLGGLRTTLTQTRYGSLWLLRLGSLFVYAAVLLGVSWWRPWQRAPYTVAALVLAALLPVPYSLISHAAAQANGAATAVAFDAAHLGAASLWAGGIFLLVFLLPTLLGELTPAGRRVVLARALSRFSLVALTAWGVLLLTGVYSAMVEVGNLAALRSTEYGQILILKLLLLVPLLALGAFNLLIVTRRLDRATTEEGASGWSSHLLTSVIAEAILLVLVFGVVGFLTGTPPAREVAVQNAGHLVIPLSADGQDGQLIITPGATGPNHYRLELGSGHEAHLRSNVGVEALLRFELAGQKTGQTEVKLIPAAAGAFEGHGSELSIAGDWTIGVTVRTPGAADWDVQATQAISSTPEQADLPPPPPLFGPVGIAGLLLLVAGLAGLVFAARVGRSPARREAAGLGAVALLVGAVLLLQARLPSVAEATGAAAIPVPDQAAVVRGQQLFLTNCAVCHGADLKGDGPDAKTLKVPPADLTAAHAVAHQDADIAYWIENGIAVGGMPGFGSKLSGQNVTDIIAYVRGVQLVAMANRDAPGAEGCTVTARTFGQIAALAQTPAAARSTPVPLADDPAAKPAATPDPEVVRGVTDTARQLIACANAGLALQRLGLYTDEAVLRAYPQGPTDALKVMAATPVAVSQIERVALVGVKDVRPLADGRVAATVVVDNPTFHTHGLATPGANVTQDVATLVFVKQDGRWLIDDVAR